jgi:hypothetical protein
VIFAPYLRTQDFPPIGAALDPSLSFSQPVNLQMRIVHPGYFCGTLQPSTHSGLRSFVVLCIKSFHNSFTISRFHTLSQKYRVDGGYHKKTPEGLIELHRRRSAAATLIALVSSNSVDYRQESLRV